MAIATNGGHVSRAIEFYDAPGKYFIIGGTKPWDDESHPPAPTPDNFKLIDVVGLKRVDNINLVVQDEDGTISYRNKNWRIVPRKIETTVGSTNIRTGDTVINVSSVEGLVEKKSKIRINNIYEGTITKISGLSLTLDTPSPADIPAYSPVLAGALVDGANYVYLDCYLNYNDFPIVTYRQVGLCTNVTPATEDILLSSSNSGVTADEYSSLGVLEILDNRIPNTRDINQREKLSLIIEF